jgi:hypothetical protein
MKRRIVHALLLKLAVLLCFVGVASAQPNVANNYGNGSGKSGSGSGGGKLPPAFVVGETLTYEGKLSKSILRGISVADLNFAIGRGAGGEDFLIKAEAKSKGTLTKLFRVSFFQSFKSSVGAERFRVLKTVKRDEQGDRIRDSEAIFDYGDRRVTYTETDPNDAMRPPRRIASTLADEETHDLISAVYNLRRLPLAVGKTFHISISDSGLVYKIPVRVAAREQQDSVLGRKIWCFRIEPEVFGPNRILEQKGSMIIWITDDDRRIPVRSQINTDGYKIEVKLKKVS